MMSQGRAEDMGHTRLGLQIVHPFPMEKSGKRRLSPAELQQEYRTICHGKAGGFHSRSQILPGCHPFWPTITSPPFQCRRAHRGGLYFQSSVSHVTLYHKILGRTRVFRSGNVNLQLLTYNVESLGAFGFLSSSTQTS